MIFKFFSDSRKRIVVFMGLLTASAATLFYCEQKDDDPALSINEICGSNFSVAADENGEYSDYIEIYNSSDQEIVEDYYLSDSKKKLKKLKIATPIAPGEYRIIWLSGEHAPFNVDKQGETIYLSTGSGRVIDAIAMPLLPYDVSFARNSDGVGEFAPFTGTPGQSNKSAESVEVRHIKSPEFSLEDGFYEEGIELKLSAGLFDSIYYTDDGSEPTEKSMQYKKPIKLYDASTKNNIYANEIMYPTYEAPNYKVDKANVIKAIAVNKITGEKSEVVNHVYFVGFDKKPQYDNVEIMSLVFDPDSLFGYDKGIYAMGKKYDEYKKLGGFTDFPEEEVPGYFIDENGEQIDRFYYTNSSYEGREWERRGTMTFFRDDADRSLLDKKDIGVRIAGESTRFVYQKSLNLFTRSIYSEDSSFNCGFYDGEKKIRLRKGDGRIIYKEAFLHSVLEDMGIAGWESRPCVLFLNGEYWGLYTLREQYEAKYFEHHFGIPQSNLYVVKNTDAEYGGFVAERDYAASIEGLAYYDLSDDEKYDLVDSSVDLDNMVDYYSALLFFNDVDIDPDHNQLLYKEAKDGKWKWAAYDLDVTCEVPEFDTVLYYREMGEKMYLPGGLYAREGFKDKFRARVKELTDTELSYESLHAKLMEWDGVYREQNIETIRRFEDSSYSEEDYEKDLAELDNFFKERGEYIKGYLEEDMANY